MYNNIGGKIKILAIVICIIQLAASIFLGLALMAINEDFILTGFLLMLIGPVIAWISTWLLYGFGELIEASRDNEKNTREILNILRTKSYDNSASVQNAFDSFTPDAASQPQKEYAPSFEVKDTVFSAENSFKQSAATVEEGKVTIHKWRCDKCGKMRMQSPCEFCGNQ